MSDENHEKASKSDKVDDELSKLLDSALEDFKKGSEEPPKDKQPTTEDPPKPEELELVDEWSEDFIRQAAAQFETNLSKFLGANPDGTPFSEEQVQQKFQEMAEAAQQVIENPSITENSSDFASTISQTLQGLNAGAENLQQPFSQQDIMNIFGSDGDQNSFLPFMQGMMQTLLSKDILYPSIKDILDKFPEWLENNKATLTKEDAERYENQRKLMQEVCTELEKEQEADSVDVKKERFDKVLVLMQKLQDYGQPPTELVGNVGSPLPTDFGVNADPNQCNLM